MTEQFNIISQDAHGKFSTSNRLARAAQGLSLSEKRIIALALAGQDSKSPSKLAEASTVRGWKFKILELDYAGALSIDPNTAYDQLRAGAEWLFERHVTY